MDEVLGQSRLFTRAADSLLPHLEAAVKSPLITSHSCQKQPFGTTSPL